MDSNTRILYFITSNNHKFKEISRLFEEESLNYQLKQYDIEIDDDAEQEGQAVLSVFPGEQGVGISGHDVDAVGDRLYLQCQQRQQGDAHCQRDGRPDPGAAEAKRQDIGQRRQLVYPAQAQQG